MSENVRERDLVLAPNEFAFILDETKGHVIAYVGPHKTSLANTDRPVSFDENSRRYRRCSLEEAIRLSPYAEEGWYVVLENPAPEGDDEHPRPGPNSTVKLTWGRKVNTPGPITFPLWPGQMASVVQGHHLRSNQYLVVKVYNEEAARDNWARAVIKRQKDEAIPLDAPPLTLGQMHVIKGTEISFYIPSTGMEVLRDESSSYVRDAVTLERLEYCILLDEDGNKRYIQGPDVVFPRPTEAFVTRNGLRKFKAMELNEISGIYVKVITPYTDESGVDRKVGEELFITGKDQMIYFPRPEHALIRYGEKEIHYAVAVPAGQARYVLNRLTGDITLKHGPCMYLADPRREVLIRRILSPNQCLLYYPGNNEVLEYNLSLAGQQQQDRPMLAKKAAAPGGGPYPPREKADVGEALVSDDFSRSQKFTQPRMLTLDTRFEGAVNVNVWTGYAILVISRTGARRVVVGPATVVLEYDETLEAMELSTGTPKTDDHLMKTGYLRVLNNKVSDLIHGETRDLCRVSVQVSYRVNFEGDHDRWFNVENYVKFLTDHLRSVVRNAIKRRGIEDFHAEAIAVVRDAVLGAAAPGGRTGRVFEENGMRVYDVDILDVRIGDEEIATIFTETQHDVVRQAIHLAQEEKLLESTQRSERIKQAVAEARHETSRKEIELKLDDVARQLQLEVARIEAEGQGSLLKLQQRENQQASLDKVQEAELQRNRRQRALDLELAELAMHQRIEELAAQVRGTVDRAQAITPDLIAALQSFADQALAGKMAESMAPLAILGGKSVSDVLQQLLKGTALEAALSSRMLKNGGQVVEN